TASNENDASGVFRIAPGFGANRTCASFNSRVVVTPVIWTRNPPAVRTTSTLRRTGGSASIETVRLAVAGAPTPPTACSDSTDRVNDPATVPHCSANCATGNSARTEFAGTVNTTVRPPVENCTAGSSAGLAPPGANVTVNRPVREVGYGSDSVSCTRT